MVGKNKPTALSAFAQNTRSSIPVLEEKLVYLYKAITICIEQCIVYFMGYLRDFFERLF